jgi:hypothetical protein
VVQEDGQDGSGGDEEEERGSDNHVGGNSDSDGEDDGDSDGEDDGDDNDDGDDPGTAKARKALEKKRQLAANKKRGKQNVNQSTEQGAINIDFLNSWNIGPRPCS